MNKVKNSIFITLLLIFMLVLSSCSSQVNANIKNKDIIVEMKLAEKKHDALLATAISVEPYIIPHEFANIKIIGFSFGNTKGTEISSDSIIGAIAKSLFIMTADKGNRDARFALYYEASVTDNVESARDLTEIEEWAYRLIDNKNDEGVYERNSLKGEYLKIDKPSYGSMLYHVYLDSESFDVIVPSSNNRNIILRFNIAELTDENNIAKQGKKEKDEKKDEEPKLSDEEIDAILKNIVVKHEAQQIINGEQKLVVYTNNNGDKTFNGNLSVSGKNHKGETKWFDMLFVEDLEAGKGSYSILWVDPNYLYDVVYSWSAIEVK